jgi:hypothetical protein
MDRRRGSDRPTAAGQIREGHRADARQLELCRLCDFRDVCRYDARLER